MVKSLYFLKLAVATSRRSQRCKNETVTPILSKNVDGQYLKYTVRRNYGQSCRRSSFKRGEVSWSFTLRGFTQEERHD